MTLWAGFISVLGYCSLLFAMVWLSHCCSCNKVINLVMTQDSLFLLEKASDNHRQRIGFSSLPATKWSNFGTADCLLQRTWVNYWRSLSTRGIPSSSCAEGTAGASVSLRYLFPNGSLAVLSLTFHPVSWVTAQICACPVRVNCGTKLRKSLQLCSQEGPKRRKCKLQGSAEHQDPWALQPLVWEQM